MYEEWKRLSKQRPARPVPAPMQIDKSFRPQYGYGPRPATLLVQPRPEELPYHAKEVMVDAQGDEEIVIGYGSTPEEAQKDLVQLMTERVGNVTNALRREENHVLASSPDSDDAQNINLTRGKHETDMFLDLHPEYYKCQENRKAMETFITENGMDWNAANLRVAFTELTRAKKLITASHANGKEQPRQDPEVRPRGSRFTQHHDPTPDEIQRKQDQEQHASDVEFLKFAHSLSPNEFKRHLRGYRDFEAKYNSAFARVAARKLGR